MTDFNGNLVLIRGVSGAGKSLIASLFKGAFSIATDNLFYDDSGKYNFDPTKLGEYHQETMMRVKAQMVHTNSVESWEISYNLIVVHNTFTEEWQMQPYIDLAEKYNWCVSTIIVENRHGSESIHSVPAHSIDKQKKDLSDNIIL